MVVAKAFYGTELFWGAFGAIAGGLSLIAAIVVPLLLARTPRQRLVYRSSSTSLLPQLPRWKKDHVELRYKEQQVKDPYVVEIVLTNVGRKDIPSTAFDRQRPLVFGVGAYIIAILDVRRSLPGTPQPECDFDWGSFVEMKPELLPARQEITISVLVDGSVTGRPVEHITVENVLENISVSEEGSEPERKRWPAWRLLRVGIVVAGTISLCAQAFLVWSLSR